LASPRSRSQPDQVFPTPRSGALKLVLPLGPRLAVTGRCRKDDLDERRPLSIDKLSERHKIVRKFVSLRGERAEGQEIVRSIRAAVPIWSLHWGRMRAATCEDRGYDVVWLLAAATHRAGDRSDAYEHFERLHSQQRLLPTADDYTALIKERNAEIVPRLVERAAAILEAARHEPETPQTTLLPDGVTLSVFVENVGAVDHAADMPGIEEITVAIGTEGLKEGWLPLVLSVLAPTTEQANWEYCDDFPGRGPDRRELRFRLIRDFSE
jgi:hypothetical protein